MPFAPKDDPYHDHKKCHWAAAVRSDGAVSALCFAKPRRINLNVARWTITESHVTCKDCLRLMAQGEHIKRFEADPTGAEATQVDG